MDGFRGGGLGVGDPFAAWVEFLGHWEVFAVVGIQRIGGNVGNVGIRVGNRGGGGGV